MNNPSVASDKQPSTPYHHHYASSSTTTFINSGAIGSCTSLLFRRPLTCNIVRRYRTPRTSSRIRCSGVGGKGGFSDDASNNNMQSMGDENSPLSDALEGLLIEALRTYYQGSPVFSEAEFNTLRDELEHLGISQLRLANMEKLWVQASSSRAFDTHIRQEFDLSEEDLGKLKRSLLVQNIVRRPKYLEQQQISTNKPQSQLPSNNNDNDFVANAEQLGANDDVNERLKWFLFSDASEERFKIMLLYLPAVVMSFVTACVVTILFALLDGEMQIYITTAGRFRLGILSYIVVMLTFWFSNQVTPTMMNYLDLGQPTLIRGDCPMCGSPVSCLFTGAARVRDERKCGVCGSTVGFNRRWAKTYLVSPPGTPIQSGPD